MKLVVSQHNITIKRRHMSMTQVSNKMKKGNNECHPDTFDDYNNKQVSQLNVKLKIVLSLNTVNI